MTADLIIRNARPFGGPLEDLFIRDGRFVAADRVHAAVTQGHILLVGHQQAVILPRLILLAEESSDLDDGIVLYPMGCKFHGQRIAIDLATEATHRIQRRFGEGELSGLLARPLDK